jgi:hypothetical protein
VTPSCHRIRLQQHLGDALSQAFAPASTGGPAAFHSGKPYEPAAWSREWLNAQSVLGILDGAELTVDPGSNVRAEVRMDERWLLWRAASIAIVMQLAGTEIMPVHAQGAKDLVAPDKQVVQLYWAGKYAEALEVAK